MLTSERDMAVGESSSLTASGHVIVDDAAPQIIPTRMPHGPATGGEIDESSYPALVSALEGFAGEPGDICVYLACMAFCGLVGLTRVSLSGHGARRVALPGPASEGRAAHPRLGLHAGPGPARAGQQQHPAAIWQHDWWRNANDRTTLPVERPSGNVDDSRERRAERPSA
jgi:hypothetical protein